MVSHMSLFLLIFCTIYGSMHAYLIWKVCRAFPGIGRWRFLVYVFCVTMIALMFLGRSLQREQRYGAARTVQFAAYVWFPIIFWFFSLGIGVEVFNLAVRALAIVAPRVKQLLVRPRPQLAAAAVLTVSGLIWGFMEASHVRLRTLTIRTPRLAAGSDPIRIVHLTDLHLSLLVGKRHLRRVLSLIERARPDLIVTTGDLVDSPDFHMEQAGPMLAGLEAPLGKYACTGNHEYYRGIAKCAAFYRRAGLLLLHGESIEVDQRLRLVGVDDPAALRTKQSAFVDEDEALGSRRSSLFTILLKHRPAVQTGSVGRFDLQLSGHSHGGQVFPFQLFVRMFHPVLFGLRQLDQGSQVYVSRGAGTWGPPLRVLAPPEVTLILLTPA